MYVQVNDLQVVLHQSQSLLSLLFLGQLGYEKSPTLDFAQLFLSTALAPFILNAPTYPSCTCLRLILVRCELRRSAGAGAVLRRQHVPALRRRAERIPTHGVCGFWPTVGCLRNQTPQSLILTSLERNLATRERRQHKSCTEKFVCSTRISARKLQG